MKKIKIVITSGFRWSYFQWFLLGLYELAKKGIVEIEFKLPLGSRMLFLSNNEFVLRIANKYRTIFEQDTYNMDGYTVFPDGKKKTFTIDSADAPYLFDSEKLENCDVYFKMQCPKNLEAHGFPLTEDIVVPWLDHKHVAPDLKKLTQRGERRKCNNFAKYRHKIKPLMVGPRALSERGLCYRRLDAGYQNNMKDRKIWKNKRIMCYFGNAMGPEPEKDVMYPDFDWEKDIMGFYHEQISHPNEKRAKVVDIVSELPNCDARIITQNHSDIGIIENKELVVPLNQFCSFISDFQYNINVSGYRKSMPNRFIESFMVGTCVLTDKLEIQWYRPFDENEVKETVEMGYLPMDNVDWKQFKNDLNSLSMPDSKKIIASYEEKWAPEVVAKYIIDTIKNS